MQCLSRQVIVRYTKLPTIVQYIIGFGKSKSSEEENLMLILMTVSTLFNEWLQFFHQIQKCFTRVEIYYTKFVNFLKLLWMPKISNE